MQFEHADSVDNYSFNELSNLRFDSCPVLDFLYRPTEYIMEWPYVE